MNSTDTPGTSPRQRRCRRSAVVAGLAVATLACLSLYLSSASSAAAGAALPEDPAPAKYKPVAPLEVVMEHADDLFFSFETSIEKKRFRSLGKDALFAAEVMNLSTLYPVEKKEDEPAWKKFAVSTRDLLVELSKLAKEQDAEKAEALIEKIDASCESCHEKFRD